VTGKGPHHTTYFCQQKSWSTCPAQDEEHSCFR